MFTGIIERPAPVLAVADAEGRRRVSIRVPWTDVRHGDSIAINGVCLTVADLQGETLGFDVVRETLDRTTLGTLRAGDLVHVERAMQIGARVDGHFVQGHVDGVGTVVKQVANQQDWRLVGRVPDALAKYLVPKGSITLDGVSLTLAKLHGPHFEIALIPTTLELTQLGRRAVGEGLNVECDVLAKTIVSFLEQRDTTGIQSPAADRFWE